MTFFVTMMADVDFLGLAFGRFPIDLHAIEQSHLLQTSWSLEDLGIDRVGRGRLATVSVAARLVKPVDLRLDLAFEFLERLLEFVHIHWGALVFDDERRRGAPVNGNSLGLFHESSKSSASRPVKRIENEVVRF